ncbi:MAG: ABC transporter permease [Candidatus Altiarchaeota archaeon]
MNIRAVKTIWLRECRVYYRDKAGRISSIARSVLWLVVFGGGFGAARFQGLGVDYQEFLFPGILAMSLLFTSIRSGISVIWDKEFGFMKEILVSPASRFEIMAGKVLGGSTIAMTEACIILLLGPLVGANLTPLNVVASIALMLLISLSLVSIGLIASSIMKTFEGFNTIMTFLIMPMFFLSGALFPVEQMPSWMSYVVAVNPLTYGVDALRWVLVGVGHTPLAIDLAVLGLAAAVTMGFGVRAFNNRD